MLNNASSFHLSIQSGKENSSPEYTLIVDILNTTSMLNLSGSSTFNRNEMLIASLGEKRKDIASVITLTVVYTLIFISGVFGNVATCLVIAKNNYMHTVTNYYLFSLAVSDTLTLILGLPPELYCIWEAYPWRFGEVFCIFKSFLSEMTSYSSVLTITAFTAERYIAICYPIKSQTLSNLSRAVKIIVLIWIIAALFALPYPICTRTFYYLHHEGDFLDESLVCNIPTEWLREMKYVFQFSTCIFFILPMGIISVMYVLIGRNLSKSNFTANAGQINSNYATKAKARTAVIKMLVAVVVAFFCCWAPFNAQRLMTSFMEPHSWTQHLLDIQGKLFYVSGVLYFLGSTVNPILYNLISKKFRVAFKRTLCRCCYDAEELRELSGRSILFSERSTCLHRNQLSTTTLLTKSPLQKFKSGGALLSLRESNSKLISGKVVIRNKLKPSWNTPILENKLSHSPNPAHLTILQERKWMHLGRDEDKSEAYLNITSSSLFKVSSKSSIISFTELQKNIFVELNSQGSQSNVFLPEKHLLGSNSTFL